MSREIILSTGQLQDAIGSFGQAASEAAGSDPNRQQLWTPDRNEAPKPDFVAISSVAENDASGGIQIDPLTGNVIAGMGYAGKLPPGTRGNVTYVHDNNVVTVPGIVIDEHLIGTLPVQQSAEQAIQFDDLTHASLDAVFDDARPGIAAHDTAIGSDTSGAVNQIEVVNPARGAHALVAGSLVVGSSTNPHADVHAYADTGNFGKAFAQDGARDVAFGNGGKLWQFRSAIISPGQCVMEAGEGHQPPPDSPLIGIHAESTVRGLGMVVAATLSKHRDPRNPLNIAANMAAMAGEA